MRALQAILCTAILTGLCLPLLAGDTKQADPVTNIITEARAVIGIATDGEDGSGVTMGMTIYPDAQKMVVPLDAQDADGKTVPLKGADGKMRQTVRLDVTRADARAMAVAVYGLTPAEADEQLLRWWYIIPRKVAVYRQKEIEAAE